VSRSDGKLSPTPDSAPRRMAVTPRPAAPHAHPRPA
jgi:hypothetical protein